MPNSTYVRVQFSFVLLAQLLAIFLFLVFFLVLLVSTPCPNKKGATKLMAVTLSNLNRFSKFLYHLKEKEISNKTMYYFPPHLKYVATLPLGISNFKFGANLEENANKKSHMNQLSFHTYRKIKP